MPILIENFTTKKWILNLRHRKLCDCVPVGISPLKWFLEISNMKSRLIWVRLWGIEPSSRFLNKSKNSSDLRFLIFEGIFPVNLFLDKFNETNANKFSVFTGVSSKKMIVRQINIDAEIKMLQVEKGLNHGENSKQDLSIWYIYFLFCCKKIWRTIIYQT